MYTELKITAKLKRNKELEDKLIKEEIEGDKVGPSPLLGGSPYFDEDIMPSLQIFGDYSILNGCGNIMNYESEINTLLEVIKPFVISWEGHIWYEEYNKPKEILTMDGEIPVLKDTDATIPF